MTRRKKEEEKGGRREEAGCSWPSVYWQSHRVMIKAPSPTTPSTRTETKSRQSYTSTACLLLPHALATVLGCLWTAGADERRSSTQPPLSLPASVALGKRAAAAGIGATHAHKPRQHTSHHPKTMDRTMGLRDVPKSLIKTQT